ncbi:Uma2 family endonuclease [Brasilonema bromeliae]|uniref:Uma2 family endonuclease n=1 Tax=Brasilonema bromeliae SPC951 TaxID=385972 RepID=A0ABX1PBG9_9CYAN|nr:Uma2 family endonuclease [Brasilonema bromeliae]NMG21303.1 Uma2 family endonuclease [Brasilonema bromeliae SPC951]
MVQIPAKLVTLEEFLKLPETEPTSEYIDGRIIQKPMPQGEHSVIQTELAPAINLVVKSKQIARAFCELRCTYPAGSRSSSVYGGRSIVPDISVFLWGRIPRKENGGVANIFSIAPDWTIEILSPDQSQTKVTKNILHCLKHGTQMGWLIDPEEQSVFVYPPDQSPTFYDEPGTRLPMPEFAKDFNLTVEGLFGWLLE